MTANSYSLLKVTFIVMVITTSFLDFPCQAATSGEEILKAALLNPHAGHLQSKPSASPLGTRGPSSAPSRPEIPNTPRGKPSLSSQPRTSESSTHLPSAKPHSGSPDLSTLTAHPTLSSESEPSHPEIATITSEATVPSAVTHSDIAGHTTPSVPSSTPRTPASLEGSPGGITSPLTSLGGSSAPEVSLERGDLPVPAFELAH